MAQATAHKSNISKTIDLSENAIKLPQCRALGVGGTLGISGWGYAAQTLEPLAYTRASSAEFCYPILE